MFLRVRGRWSQFVHLFKPEYNDFKAGFKPKGLFPPSKLGVCRDKWGRTPLFWTVLNGHADAGETHAETDSILNTFSAVLRVKLAMFAWT